MTGLDRTSSVTSALSGTSWDIGGTTVDLRALESSLAGLLSTHAGLLSTHAGLLSTHAGLVPPLRETRRHHSRARIATYRREKCVRLVLRAHETIFILDISAGSQLFGIGTNIVSWCGYRVVAWFW